MPGVENEVPNPDAEVAFEVGEEDKETTVEIEQNSDGEVTSARLSEETTEQAKPEGEHREYSAKVKKRLDQLTAKMREAERREQAALQYATSVQHQLVAAQQRASQLDKGYLNETEGRISSQMAIVEANLQDAVERNDGKAAVEAQKLLSQLILQQERVKAAKTSRPAQAQTYAPPAQPQPQAPRAPDRKAEEWAEKHEWFGSDKVMTRAAFSIHEDLAAEGFDLASDEYYDELDERLRKEFPHKFRRTPQVDNGAVQPVAPATRGISVPSGRRQVKLTPSEVSMARRIGVPLEEYAKHVRR
jgi:hypothetical protein